MEQDWIEWSGDSAAPVPMGTRVKVKMAGDNGLPLGPFRAEFVYWAEVVCYQVVMG